MSRPTQHIAGSLLGLILILAVGTGYAKEERNCPARVFIHIVDDTGFPGAPLAIEMEHRIAERLAAHQLKHATFQFGSDMTLNLARETMREQALLERLKKQEITFEEFEKLSSYPPEEKAKLDQTTECDFLIKGHIVRFGSLFVVNSSVHRSDAPIWIEGRTDAHSGFFNMAYQGISRFSASGDSVEGIYAQADPMAAKFAEALANKFYCIDLEPNPIDPGNRKTTPIVATVKDLKDRLVTVQKPVHFSVTNPGAGTVAPSEASLHSGRARSQYQPKKEDDNEVKARVQAEPAPGLPGLISVDKVSVGKLPQCYLLHLEGQSSDRVSAAGGVMDTHNTFQNTADVPLCVDSELVDPQAYSGVRDALKPLEDWGQATLDNMRQMPGAEETLRQVEAAQPPQWEPYRSIWGEGTFKSHLNRGTVDWGNQGAQGGYQRHDRFEPMTEDNGQITVQGRLIGETAYLQIDGSVSFDPIQTGHQSLKMEDGTPLVDMDVPTRINTHLILPVVIPFKDGAQKTVAFHPHMGTADTLNGQFNQTYTLQVTALKDEDPRCKQAKAHAENDPGRAMRKAIEALSPEALEKLKEQSEESQSSEESSLETAPRENTGEDTSQTGEQSFPLNEESPFAPQTPEDFAPQDPESTQGGTSDEAPEEEPNVPVRPKDIWDTVKEYLPGY